MISNAAFWETKSLEEMSAEEWEQLCDGCARCCAFKLEDEDSGEFFVTDVCCRYLDLDSCRCTHYPLRHQKVPDCVEVTPELARNAPWLPNTCAYRLLAHGDSLPAWHPLISGHSDSVAAAGISVAGYVHHETPGIILEQHLLDWPDY